MTIELVEPNAPQPAAGPPLVRVEGLTKRYGRFQAVDRISFEVPRGSIFGFVGPNGAGKTTTIKILATLLEPSEGLAWVGGYDVVRQAGRVRDLIGYMPDFFGVYDDLSVIEYLDFYSRTQGVGGPGRAKLLDDLLELVELNYKRNALVETLSRGMKQRLCLARCLVHDPQVLLLDEPASGLDPRARVEMRELLKELQRMGKTIIVSSHILPELAELCTDIGIVDRGRFLAGGPVEEVIRQYGRRSILRVRLSPEEKDQAQNNRNGAGKEAAGLALQFERAVAVLQAQPWARADVRPTVLAARGEVEVSFGGTDAALRQTLAALVGAGVPVAGFGIERGNLEDLFLSITENRPPEEAEDNSRRSRKRQKRGQ